jgi:hypothetical protein
MQIDIRTNRDEARRYRVLEPGTGRVYKTAIALNTEEKWLEVYEPKDGVFLRAPDDTTVTHLKMMPKPQPDGIIIFEKSIKRLFVDYDVFDVREQEIVHRVRQDNLPASA